MNRRESLQLLAASAAVTTASALAGNAAFAQAMGQPMGQAGSDVPRLNASALLVCCGSPGTIAPAAT